MTSAAVAPLLARAAQSLRAGRPHEAIPVLREAAGHVPGNAQITHDLGVACYETGDVDGAARAFEAAVAANPRFAKAWYRLGVVREAAGDRGGAITALRQAAALLPSFTEAQFRLAELLELQGDDAAAAACFRRAGTAKTPLGRLGAARALLLSNRDAEAETALRRALVLAPDDPMLLDQLGSVLADAGRFAEARACFARAIERSPRLAGSFYDLARCQRMTPDDTALIERAMAATADPRLDPVQRVRLHLGLGKAFDDLGEPARAMAQFDAADRLRSRLGTFSLRTFEQRVDRLIAYSTADRIAALAAAHGCSDETPILIMGLPRSGTTLVEQIVSNHAAVGAGGELGFWPLHGTAWEQAGFAADAIDRAVPLYRDALRAIAPQAIRVTDKQPLNLFWAGLIHMAFPRATLVQCRRSLADTAVSIHQTFFHPHIDIPTGGEALVGAVRHYERLAAHWRAVLPQERTVAVDYERLTATPEPEIRALVSRCGLAWDDACLAPQANRRVVRTPSKWQARQPVYRDAVDRWRRYEPWLGPLAALVDRPTDCDAV